MGKIIVTTDFSASAENALRYACALTRTDNNLELLLLNVYTVPVSYSGDGVSMAAISDSIGDNETRLRNEFKWIHEEYPGCRIKYKEVIGDFATCLREQIEEEKISMVIMGTPDTYGEIRLWSADILNALTTLSVPVLTIPNNVTYKPVTNIGFVCILGNINTHTPIDAIKSIVKYTGARLHVINVIAHGNKEDGHNGDALLHSQLEGLDTEYHTINDPHIVGSVGQFIAEHQIDLLLVRPRKHGVWYNLFHKSYSKELAKLNLIPVMALHEKWDIS